MRSGIRCACRSILGLLVPGVIALWAAGCSTGQPYGSRAPVDARPAARAAIAPGTVLPRVMMLIEERSLGTIPTAEVEALGIELMLDENIPLVDQEMARTNVRRQQRLLQMAGDERGAAALGLEFGADVVIVGEAVAKPAARRIAESNLRAYEAVVTLKAVRTDTAQPLASVSETASLVALEDVSGSSKALKAAGRQALEKLIPRMLTKWQGYVASGGVQSRVDHITLTIGGVDQAWKLKSVRETLRGRDQLRNVVQRSYTAGLAIFELDSRLPAEELAEELVMQPPEGLRMQVLSVGKGSIELRAVSAGR